MHQKTVTVEHPNGDVHFTLPNEKSQFWILQFIKDFVSVNADKSIVAAMSSLEPAAAVLGLCWPADKNDFGISFNWRDVSRRMRSMSRDGATDEECAQERGELIIEFGEEFLDALHVAGFGKSAWIFGAFGKLTAEIGRTFVSQEAIDERLGFSKQQRDIKDS